jgi:hypothetical protein
MSAAICLSCGGPDNGEFACCAYCAAPLSAEIMASAIPCPACHTGCRWGKTHCGRCQAWLVVACVFCGALSPHTSSQCLSCNEGFAGAAQRKAARVQQQANQETMQVVGTVGTVAASFLGAFVATELSDD